MSNAVKVVADIHFRSSRSRDREGAHGTAYCLTAAVRDLLAAPYFLRMVRDRQTRRILSPVEAREQLCVLLDQGVEYIPVGPACDGFDPATGCPGHVTGAGHGPTPLEDHLL